MVTEQEYKKMTEKASPDSPSAKNYTAAFGVGGAICCVGQCVTDICSKGFGLRMDDSRALTSILLILTSAVLTALGWYSPLAKRAGAGTLVPITGFANAIVSPAIEYKSEGLVFGVGAKMFIIAGPVLVFGISVSVVYGIILWLLSFI